MLIKLIDATMKEGKRIGTSAAQSMSKSMSPHKVASVPVFEFTSAASHVLALAFATTSGFTSRLNALPQWKRLLNINLF